MLPSSGVNHYLIATNVEVSDRNHGTAVTRTDLSPIGFLMVFTLMNATASNGSIVPNGQSQRIVGRPSRQRMDSQKLVWWAIVT